MTNYGTMRDKQSNARKERGGGRRGVEMNVCVQTGGGGVKHTHREVGG